MTLTERQINIVRNVTLGEQWEARNLYNAYMKVCEADEFILKEFCLGAIFKLGKAQGIMEERRRREAR